MFGIERCNETLLASRTLPPAEAGTDLFDRLASFAGNTPQSDDIGLLLLDIAVMDKAPLKISGEFSRGPRLTSRVEKWLHEELAPQALSGKALGELSLVVEELVSNVDKYAGLPGGASIELSAEVSQIVTGEGAVADSLGDVSALAAVARFPARRRCATLAWEALGAALGVIPSDD